MSGIRWLISIAIILAIAITYFLYVHETPIGIVDATIKKVRVGSIKELNLNREDVEKITTFYSFVDNKHLSRPDVEYSEVTISNKQSQVVASFQVIEYNDSNSNLKIYDGKLIFTLQKSGFFKWSIIKIEVGKEMGEVIP